MPSNLDFLREYTGTAGDQMLVGDITAAVLLLSIDGASGWPTGAHPFVITINAGGLNEEKVLVSTRTGNALSIQQRGWDFTPASAHSAGEKVQHTDSAYDFTVFNAHGSQSSGVHGVAGNVVGDTDPMSLSNKVLVTPEIDDHSLANHDHSSVPQGGLLAYVSSPGQTLRAHFGTVSLSPGGSVIGFAHGAPFTPVTGFVSGAANVSFTSLVITSYGPTNLSVAFFAAGSNAALSVATCQISYVVFG